MRGGFPLSKDFLTQVTISHLLSWMAVVTDVKGRTPIVEPKIFWLLALSVKISRLDMVNAVN